MSVYRYVRLDVFTNQPFTGIQLAVFPDAAGIDERRMQRIANEMALPETTFVFPPEAPETDARVRIFTPTRELPMAGSPTIGTVRVVFAFRSRAVQEFSRKFGSAARRWLSAKERSSTSLLPTRRGYCSLPLCVFFPSVFSNQWWA